MKTGRKLLSGLSVLLLAVMLVGCGSLESVSEEDVLKQEEFALLQQQLTDSEERLKASVEQAQTLMAQLQEKIDILETANEDLEEYVQEIELSKDQTIGVMRVRAEDYDDKMDQREEDLLGQVDLSISTIQYEFKQFQEQLVQLEEDFDAFVSDKERLLDLKFLGTYDSLQTEMDDRFLLLENTVKAVSLQLKTSMDEFSRLKAAMTTFVNEQ